MAKKGALKLQPEEDQLQSVELAMTTAIAKLIDDGKKNLVTSTIGTNEYLDELKNTYQNIVVANIKDISGYNFVVEGEKLLKKLRTSVSNTRLKITGPAENFKKELIKEEKRILEVLQPLEENLTKQKIIFEDLTKAEKEKAFTERIKQLTENGFALVGGFYVCGIVMLNTDQIRDFDDENFNFYIEIGKKEVERVKAEEDRKKKESEELAATRAELSKALEEIRLEREKLEKEKQEIAAQKEALEKTYGKIEEGQGQEANEESKQEWKPEPGSELPPPPIEEATGRGRGHVSEEISIPPHIVTTEPQSIEGDNKEEEEEEEDELYISPQKIGFEDFREKLLSRLQNPPEGLKLSRENLIEWAKNIQM